MAQKVSVELIDDLDQTTITDGNGRTVTFGFDGNDYEIDLSSANEEKLREALSDYIAAGRKTSRAGNTRRSSGSSASPRRNRDELAAIREWATQNGYEVSNRGRISSTVQEAYAAAH